MNPHPKEVKAKILLHRRVGPDFFRLTLLSPEIARLARPGQFVMLKVNELKDPFLRRPFGFSRIFLPQKKRRRPIDEGGVEICYQVVGRGTSLMTQLREGQRLDLLGPLGKGFWPEEGRKRVILVGGGIGTAPLLSWVQELRGEGIRKKRSTRDPEEGPEILFLTGGRSKERTLGVGECRRMGLEPQVATEDGSLGIQGLATDLLEKELLTGQHESTVIYACGPLPMLARVAQMADQFDLPCQVLLESRMACGVGACLGCTVKVREEDSRKIAEAREIARVQENSLAEKEEREGGIGKESRMPVISEAAPFRYARVCKEGPVFDARKVLWE